MKAYQALPPPYFSSYGRGGGGGGGGGREPGNEARFVVKVCNINPSGICICIWCVLTHGIRKPYEIKYFKWLLKVIKSA